VAEKPHEIPAQCIAYPRGSIAALAQFMTLQRINVIDAAARRIVNDCAINEFDLAWIIIGWNFITFALIREEIAE
jgi:hypothetical protein